MKAKLYTILGLLTICLIVAFGVKHERDMKAAADLAAVSAEQVKAQAKLDELNKEIAAQKAQLEADSRLGQYAINMMLATYGGRHLSDPRKQTLARTIVKVTNDVFETVEQRHAFIMILAIESQFQKNAQSPTGPRGLSQVAKRTFFEALESCGMPKPADEDVWDPELNLYAGACYFRQQLEDADGDLFVAAVRYNQGPASKEAEKFAKTGDLNSTEGLKYLAKITYFKRVVNDKRAPEAPKFKPSKS